VRRGVLLVVLAAVAACGDRATAAGSIRVTVTRPQVAPVMLAVPARAHRCIGGDGRVITGAADMQGMLVWLVPAGGPDTGAFTVNRGADSVPGRHARVSLRYLAGDMAHALALDSGTVVVRLDGTNAAEGRALLEEAAPPNLHVEATMLSAAKRAVELAG